MAEAPASRTLALALGTFHASALMLVLVALVHRAGNLGPLLGNLSTLRGGALFLALWILATATAWRALEGSDPGRGRVDLSAMSGRGIVWGSVTGAVFAALLVAVTGFAPARLLPLVAAVFAAGGFVVGALVGLAFAALDAGLLALARAIAGPGQAPEP